MHQESDSAADLIEIYFEDAVRFFRALTHPGPCPMCSSIAWQIPVESKGKPASLVVSGLYLDGKPQLELKVSCTVCGFYRGHSASHIQRWIKDNPATEDPTDE